jgi:hypothetical protein
MSEQRLCPKHGTVMRCYKNRGRTDWSQWHCPTCDNNTKRLRDSKDPRKRLVEYASRRARVFGLPCSIKFDDITIPEVCPVLGIKLVKGVGRALDSSPSIDRKRPELGYVPGNVMVISWKANRLRNNATLDELERLVKYVRGL